MTARPTKVQAPDGCESYLTPGKIYNVAGYWGRWTKKNGHTFHIILDDGDKSCFVEKKCLHLNGKNWIVIEREGDTWFTRIIRKIKNYNL
jgi:hypothetical protein